ncbi:MAG: para-nitrobenzyl esterase [Myxococcota bacterium]|jgi:para-nitrobenzyl esterase
MIRVILALLVASSIGCGSEDEPPTIVVSQAPVFAVTERSVVYGQALTHSDWAGTEPMTVDLEALVWEPQGTVGLRPALVVIHGGAFLVGSANQRALVDYAAHFAARGWVVMSIDYRLAPSYASLPAQWAAWVATTGVNAVYADIGRAMYGAGRDGKAAVRYLQANAKDLRIDPDRIAAMGGSAGAFVALALGVTDSEDLRDELTVDEDPTLATTHPVQSGRVAAVLVHWGGTELVEGVGVAFGRPTWDASDAPIQIVHGTADGTVDFASAETIRDRYDETGVTYTFHPIADAGHGAWDARVDGQTLAELGFDFLVQHLALVVE